MTNTEFFKAYLHLQLGIVFDDLLDMGFATIAYSKNDSALYWNYAFAPGGLDDAQLTAIEGRFHKLERTPAIYFEATNDVLRQELSRRGYEKSYEDSWLFWPKAAVSTERFHSVRTVKTEEDLAVFAKTFDACYQENDPQNPYGRQAAYLPALKAAWRAYHGSKLTYFTVFDGDTPVAVAALTSENGVGYISNVGSIQAARGKGFGKVATLYAVSASIALGNRTHALATEEGEYPYNFYKRIGFEPRFSAVCFVKSSANKSE